MRLCLCQCGCCWMSTFSVATKLLCRLLNVAHRMSHHRFMRPLLNCPFPFYSPPITLLPRSPTHQLNKKPPQVWVSLLRVTQPEPRRGLMREVLDTLIPTLVDKLSSRSADGKITWVR